jgi:hypothetical protein
MRPIEENISAFVLNVAETNHNNGYIMIKPNIDNKT